jgi:hypothetical protein
MSLFGIGEYPDASVDRESPGKSAGMYPLGVLETASRFQPC